jgi:hypothetical protein
MTLLLNVHTSSNVHAKSTGRTRSSVRPSSVCPVRDPLDGRTYGPAKPPMERLARPYVHARPLRPSRCAGAQARPRRLQPPVARDHPVTSAPGTVAPYGIAGRNMTVGYVQDRCAARDRVGSPQVPGTWRTGLRCSARPSRHAAPRPSELGAAPAGRGGAGDPRSTGSIAAPATAGMVVGAGLRLACRSGARSGSGCCGIRTRPGRARSAGAGRGVPPLSGVGSTRLGRVRSPEIPRGARNDG